MDKLLGELFDDKLLKIIKFFLMNKDKEFYLQEISKQAGVPIATVFRTIKKLKELEIVNEIQIKHFKLYKCAVNEKINFLESFIKEGKRRVDSFAAMVIQIPNVEEILLYGKEAEDKANVIIIGKAIDNNEVKRICNEFREKNGYNITPLILEREQYEQISAMGLYAGEKKSLFRK